MQHSLIILLRYGGDVHIDDDENWSVNSTRGVRYMQRGKRHKKMQKTQKLQNMQKIPIITGSICFAR